MKRRMSNARWLVTVISIGLVSLAVVGFGAYGFSKWRIAAREQGAPRIALAMDVASAEVDLVLDQAVVFVLPNGKEVAVWNEKPDGLDLSGLYGGVSMNYGERPFRKIEFEEITLPSGGTTSGEALSYIRQGPVLDGGEGKPSTYVLFVDDYRLSLEQIQLKPVLRLRALAEKASEEEKRGPKQEIDYFLGLLKHEDPAMRRKGVDGLTEALIMGSTYAEIREAEITVALKALETDPDEQIRQQLSAKLSEAGDGGSILKELDAMAGKPTVDVDAAWSLGRNVRYDDKPAARAAVYRRAAVLAGSAHDSERILGVAFLSGCPVDPLAKPAILSSLADSSAAVRAVAIRGLEQIHGDDDEAVRKQTVAMLRDPSLEVVVAALESFLYVGEAGILPFKEVEPFLSHADRRVRVAAIRALRYVEDPATERPLLEISREEDAEIRAEAAECWAGSSTADVLKRFVEMLDDPDSLVRIRGIQGLDLGSAPGRATIIRERLLKETDPDVIRVGRTAIKDAE
jgi:HEAT repeat protein